MDADSTKAWTEWGAEGAAIRVGVLTFLGHLPALRKLELQLEEETAVAPCCTGLLRTK